MIGKAWDFVGISNYEVGAYSKPTLALSTLEGVLGQETMLKVMSTFFQRYQFQQPNTEDFRKTAEEVSGQKLDWFFEGLVYGREVVNYTVTAVDEHTVTVARQGKLIIPTEILVTFDDRSTVLEPWDGTDAQKVLTYPDHTVAQAEVDPGHKIMVDLQWSDNGLRRIMDLWSWMALNVRVLYQIQNWMLAWGGL